MNRPDDARYKRLPLAAQALAGLLYLAVACGAGAAIIACVGGAVWVWKHVF
jgi:hypothetical protein